MILTYYSEIMLSYRFVLGFVILNEFNVLFVDCTAIRLLAGFEFAAGMLIRTGIGVFMDESGIVVVMQRWREIKR